MLPSYSSLISSQHERICHVVPFLFIKRRVLISVGIKGEPDPLTSLAGVSANPVARMQTDACLKTHTSTCTNKAIVIIVVVVVTAAAFSKAQAIREDTTRIDDLLPQRVFAQIDNEWWTKTHQRRRRRKRRSGRGSTTELYPFTSSILHSLHLSAPFQQRSEFARGSRTRMQS